MLFHVYSRPEWEALNGLRGEEERRATERRRTGQLFLLMLILTILGCVGLIGFVVFILLEI